MHNVNFFQQRTYRTGDTCVKNHLYSLWIEDESMKRGQYAN